MAMKMAMKMSAKKMAMKMSMKKMSMKKMAMKKVTGSRRQVWSGTRTKSKGGLSKGDFIKNKRGKIVSKKRSAIAKKRSGAAFAKRGQALKKARKELGISGFCPIGGKTAQGKALKAKVDEILGN